jgi:hypothetical protein
MIDSAPMYSISYHKPERLGISILLILLTILMALDGFASLTP